MAEEFTLGCVVVALGVGLALVGCGGSSSPTEPGPTGSEELTEAIEAQSTIFHFSRGDAVAVTSQEAYNDWIEAELGITLSGKLQYFKYRSQGHMQRQTGRAANGFAVPEMLEVHSVFPWHSHETAHVYSQIVGRPSDFFNEGLAVALSVDPATGDFSPTYSGSESVHAWCRRSESQLLALGNLVTTDDFRAVPEAVGYQQAGSFVAFLLEDFGARPMLDFFSASSREDSRAHIEDSFRVSFGLGLSQAEERWRQFLGI